MTDKDQESVFGRKFEKLGQERRVEILHAYGVIDDEIKEAFNLIRTTRRRYLHLWSQDHDRLPPDSMETFFAATSIAVSVIGQNIKDGKIILNPSIVKYLQQKGVYKDSEN